MSSYPRYEVFKDGRNEYRFRLVSANYKIILASEGYTTKQNCYNGIESCQRNSPIDSRYQRLTSSNYKYYFNLIAENSRIVGTSEMYETTTGREGGIDAVKRDGPTKTISDNT